MDVLFGFSMVCGTERENLMSRFSVIKICILWLISLKILYFLLTGGVGWVSTVAVRLVCREDCGS